MKKIISSIFFISIVNCNIANRDYSILFEAFKNRPYGINHLEVITKILQDIGSNTENRRVPLLEAQLRAALRSADDFLEKRLNEERDYSTLSDITGARNAISRFKQICR